MNRSRRRELPVSVRVSFSLLESGRKFRAGLTQKLPVLLLLILAPNLMGQERSYTFEHITVNDGLSQNLVSDVLQDRRGFLWLGTKDGLNKFDGYSFLTYHRLPFDPTSLSDDYITRLYEDSREMLWIGTFRGGLNLYDRESGSFRHFDITAGRPNTDGDQITSIGEDRDGSIWIGSYGGGLSRLYVTGPASPRSKASTRNNPEPGFELTHYPVEPSQSQDTTRVLSLKVDSSGTLWIGTTSGLYCLEKAASTRLQPMADGAASGAQNERPAPAVEFRKQSFYPPNPSLGVGVIYEDQGRRLWLGTPEGLFQFDRGNRSYAHFPFPSWQIESAMGSISSICAFAVSQHTPPSELWLGTQNGVAIFDPSTRSYRYLLHDPTNAQSLSAGRILSIYQDRSGVLWLGSNGNGLNKHDPLSTRFPYPDYRNVLPAALPKSARSLSVRAFYEDPSRHKDILWIGTSEALFRADRKAGTLERISSRGGDSPVLGAVYSILEDSQGVLWIGGGQGLFEYDPESSRTVQYKPSLVQADGAEDNRVFKLQLDKDGNLWAVTARTIARFDRDSHRFIHYRYRQDPPNRFEQPVFPSIYEDAGGQWWLGTESGLYRFNVATETFKHFQYDPQKPSGLNSDVVRCVEPDPVQPQRYLWLGTAGGGLNRLDLSTETFAHYTQADGLADNFVYGILSDEQGALWMSTNGGISRLDPRSLTFKNYDISDGLQGNEFNSGAYFKSSSGELFFGGINGFNSFFPARIRHNAHIPAIVITAVHVSSLSTAPQNRVLYLKNPLRQLEEIHLSHKDKILSFDLAALNFSMPQKNQYAYKLEGLNDNWIHIGKDRRATFTYLAPGKYIFRVKGSNNDGVWNEDGAALKIIITPPFWMTWWAYGLYALFALSVLYGIRRYELDRLLLKHDLALLQEDVRLAASIQQSLMPKECPQVPGYDIAAKTLPSRTVGGDCYDFIAIDAQRTSFSVGDAAGKAMPAALLMANVQAVVRCQSLSSVSAKDCVHIANKILFQKTGSNSFVTLFYSVLDGSTHRLQFCNAGHNYPLLFSKKDEPRELRTGGMVLGLFEDASYEQEEVEFQRGDLLVLYSDGISEAMNSAGEEFGAETLKSLVARHMHEPAGELIELILAEVQRHMGGFPQHDDMTLMLIRRKG